ncbi:MAG: DUF1636 domain-containing protein [Pseudomonadota bacterium]
MSQSPEQASSLAEAGPLEATKAEDPGAPPQDYPQSSPIVRSRAAMTEIAVCDTCKHPDGVREKDGVTGGGLLLDAVRAAVEALPEADRSGLSVRGFSCLMSCSRACAASVGPAAGAAKTSYVLGGFEPSAAAAEALVGYALGHVASEDGVVPYKTWPQGVKGKFVARIPPRPPKDEPET